MILNISSITYYPSTISLKKKNFSSWKQHLGVPINIFRYLSPIIRSPGFSGSSIVKSFPLPKMCSWASAMGVVGCRSTSSRGREFIERRLEAIGDEAHGRVAYYTFLLFIDPHKYRFRRWLEIYGGPELVSLFFIGILIWTRLSSLPSPPPSRKHPKGMEKSINGDRLRGPDS